MVNALDVITNLEPVEYDQTYNLISQSTTQTPQAYQCNVIAQTVGSIEELINAVIGCEIGKDGNSMNLLTTIIQYVLTQLKQYTS